MYLLLYGQVGFFPKPGDAAHTRRTYLTDGMLYFFRVMVDDDIYASVKAEVCPGLLKDMAQRQETERRIILAQSGQTLLVDRQCRIET